MPTTNIDLFRGDLLSNWQREMERTMRQFASLSGGLGREGQEQGSTLAPPVEVTEDENAYRITLELPGFEPNQIEANVSGRTLTVRAERQQETQREQSRGQSQQGQQEQRRPHVLINERSYGQVRRQLHLPDDIDPNRVEAQFRHGLLTLTVPKSQQTRDQQRRIEIKGN